MILLERPVEDFTEENENKKKGQKFHFTWKPAFQEKPKD